MINTGNGLKRALSEKTIEVNALITTINLITVDEDNDCRLAAKFSFEYQVNHKNQNAHIVYPVDEHQSAQFINFLKQVFLDSKQTVCDNIPCKLFLDIRNKPAGFKVKS